MTRFFPEEWAAVYERKQPEGLAFRRAAEVARDAVLAWAEAGTRWADVGSGTGHLAGWLAEAGLDVFGVDADPAMVADAARRFPSARFLVGDAGRLPFGEGTLDGVAATSLLGCLPDPAPFLAEARRVLRPGGLAVLTFTNRQSVLHAIDRRLPGKSSLSVPAHAFSLPEATAALEDVGLRVQELGLFNCHVTAGRRTIPPLSVARAIESRSGRRLARNVLAVASAGPPPVTRPAGLTLSSGSLHPRQ